MQQGKPENVIDLKEFRDLDESAEPDLRTLIRLSRKTSEVVLGLHQSVMNIESQMSTFISRVEVVRAGSDREDERVTKLEVKLDETIRLLNQLLLVLDKSTHE